MQLSHVSVLAPSVNGRAWGRVNARTCKSFIVCFASGGPEWESEGAWDTGRPYTTRSGVEPLWRKGKMRAGYLKPASFHGMPPASYACETMRLILSHGMIYHFPEFLGVKERD
ncbi:hypothetical protein B0H14DRAFT_2650821 [Mycena olivaceomarginata]|nr:hypothetical protein B0H14DRAFT_2650821 [Mycena olivaceomarginata]